jgi:glycosyltransferase involved in cell wall biosynthesis
VNEQTVSAIIPVRDCERFIAEAISSIRRQTVPVSELIVVDDGSTDRTAEVVKRHDDLTYLYQAPSGQSAARNRGASRASGRFLAFLDADDLWMPDKIQRQLEEMTSRPELGAVFGHAIQFRERDDENRAVGLGPPIPAWHPSAMLIKRDEFHRVGTYSSDWLDCKLAMAMLPEIVFERRLHARNLGRTLDRPTQHYLRVLREVIARRRTPPP